jgi:hypothetical protein
MHSKERSPLLSALLVFALLSMSTSFLHGEQLSAPEHRVRFTGPFENRKPVPTWSNNLVISKEIETYYYDLKDNLAVRNREGKLLGTYRIWFPDASMVSIADVAASRDGSVAAVGFLQSTSGLADAWNGPRFSVGFAP